MRLEKDPAAELRGEAFNHPKTCICAGCFLNWEARESNLDRLRFYHRIQLAMEEAAELRRQGKLPPDDRVYGRAA